MQTKYSKQKEMLLKVLCSTTSHPNADWIYGEIKKEIPSISLGTVYRNLSKMSQDGTILKLHFKDGCDYFDGNTSPHHHMVCKNCGAIIDIFTGSDEEVQFNNFIKNYAQHHTHATIENHSIVFYGFCPRCN